MEVKFKQDTLHYLYPIHGQVHSGEQTQEIRLPDAYPDIGKVLGCWGQVLIRGKEWKNGSLGANGGVMAFVLYAPEDGTQPRVVDAWIPIQCRWDLPEQEDDGIIHLCPTLANIDARGISARKLILRASVETFAQALCRKTVDISTAPELPDDVQLLKQSYPIQLPKEAGEKQVSLDERLVIPGNQPPVHKIVCYWLRPAVTEQKILGNRLVFRGESHLNVLYMTEEGSLCQWNTEIPMAQYTELDRDYSHKATARIYPLITSMELELVEGQFNLRGGIAAQYTIYDSEMLELVEDAFSPSRNVALTTEKLSLPILLDYKELSLPMEGVFSFQGEDVVLTTPMAGYPGGTETIQLEGQMHVLLKDEESQLYGDSINCAGTVPFPSDNGNQNVLWLGVPEKAEISSTGDSYVVKTSYPVMAEVYSGEIIPMVTALELGDIQQSDAQRPSLILRRAGEEGLWGLAKLCGSTVADIQEANHLTEKPEPGQILLIPIC